MSPSFGLWGFFSSLFSSLSPRLLLTAVSETVCWSQTQTGTARLLPGERANRARWHFWCKHVARWRAKSLVGGLYLFFKELVRFIYTRHRPHMLEETGETHSLSALGPQGCWSCQQEHASSWQAEASSKVSAWLREILTPPRSTSSAFKEHKRQVLSCHASCPVFPKAKLFFQGLGKADLAPAPSPWPRGCSKPCAYPSTSSEHERGCSSSPTQN